MMQIYESSSAANSIANAWFPNSPTDRVTTKPASDEDCRAWTLYIRRQILKFMQA